VLPLRAVLVESELPSPDRSRVRFSDPTVSLVPRLGALSRSRFLFSCRLEFRLLPLLLDPPEALLLPLELLRLLPPLDRFSRPELLLRLELPLLLFLFELLLPLLLLLELLVLLLLLELLSAPPCLLWARALVTSAPATHNNTPILNATM